MKKNIIKIIIGLVLVVGAIVSFNVEAKAIIKPDDGDYNKKSLAQKSDGSYCCANSTDWNNCTSSPDC